MRVKISDFASYRQLPDVCFESCEMEARSVYEPAHDHTSMHTCCFEPSTARFL